MELMEWFRVAELDEIKQVRDWLEYKKSDDLAMIKSLIGAAYDAGYDDALKGKPKDGGKP